MPGEPLQNENARSVREHLIALLGLKAARRLMRAYGGHSLHIPALRLQRTRLEARNQRILELLKNYSYAEVARRLRLDPSWVFRLANRG
jgi:Mor family transcriptional regulator